MIDRSQTTEIAVAASLATRERPQQDHDGIGILTVTAYYRLLRDGSDASRLVTAREIADAVCAKIDVMEARVEASRGVDPLESASNPAQVDEEATRVA